MLNIIELKDFSEHTIYRDVIFARRRHLMIMQCRFNFTSQCEI